MRSLSSHGYDEFNHLTKEIEEARGNHLSDFIRTKKSRVDQGTAYALSSRLA